MKFVLAFLALAAAASALYYWHVWQLAGSVDIWEIDQYAYPYRWRNVWTGEGAPFKLWTPYRAIVASALTPNGTEVELYFKKVTALFQIPEVDPTRDIYWYYPYPIPKDRYIPHLEYYLQVPIKIGRAPIFNITQKVPLYIEESVLRNNIPLMYYLDYPKRQWALKPDPGPTGSHLLLLSIGFVKLWHNDTELCVEVYVRSPFLDRAVESAWTFSCEKFLWGPGFHNITVVALERSVEVYVDGRLAFAVLLKGAGLREMPIFTSNPRLDVDDEPWIWVGPAWYDTVEVGIWSGSGGIPLRPLGNVTLLIGNDTLSLPPYVYVSAARASDFDGFWLRDLPPPYVPTANRPYRYQDAYIETPRHTVYFNETPAKLLRGTLLRLSHCNLTEGGVVPLVPGLAVVLGEGRVYCPKYKVAVRLPNGTVVELWARPGEVVAYDPPPVVELGNGTRLVEPQPVRVKVNYSDAYAEAKYGAREYLIRFATPLGAVEEWAREGANATYPGADVDLGNGTRLVVHPMSIPAYWPTTASPSYDVYYRVVVDMPFNTSAAWAKRGTQFEYKPPHFVDLGNKTALREPNGTCAFRVDGPKACTITYRERLYWVSINAPFNRTEGWALKGSVVRLPEVFDLGNGTRWVGSGYYAVVDKPINVTATYKRQYYVELSGVVEWRGWKDEGSQIRLNETVVGGVKYVPQTPFIEVRGPVSAKPRYTAYYYAQFNDALGLPNPWVSVELCGRRFAADDAGRAYAVVETDTRCVPKVEAPPLGPYSLAILGAAVAVAAVVAVRRLKKR